MKLRGLALVFLLIAAEARAECPSTDGAARELAEVDARERLRLVQSTLRDERRHAETWTAWWAATGVVAMGAGVAYGATAPTDGLRTDAYYGAATSALLPLFVIAWPLEATAKPEDSEADSDPCTALASAERRLVRVAADEELRTGPWAHAASVVTSVLLALPLGLVFGRWNSFVVNATLSELVGLVQIASTPRHARDALRRYRAGLLSESTNGHGAAYPYASTWGLVFTLTP